MATKNNIPQPDAPTAFNNLSHGASSKTLFLPDEDPAEFLALLEDAFEDHKPGSKQASGIVAGSVHDYWILLRRERAADNYEVKLHLRHPDSTHWTPTDLHQMDLLDRYRTTASRQYSRALTNIAKIKKLKHDELRWQQNLELQKQQFALAVERFNLAKAKQSPPLDDLHDDFDDDLEEEEIGSSAPPTPGSATQDLYIGLEGDKTVIYEITPTNAHLRGSLTESDSVTRIYHFIGGVPEAYKHLITPNAAKWGKSTTVTKLLSFYDWQDLADLE